MPDVAPIRRSIQVNAAPDDAFVLFTAHIGAWWPTAAHSVYGDGSLVAFEGDRLVERSPEGTAVWAEVIDWDPPAGFRLSWHPGHDAAHATDLLVRFDAADGGTTVLLEHSGWERMEHPAQAAANYGNGWPIVLERFGDRVCAYASDASTDDSGAPDVDSTASDDTPATWFALIHTPGPLLDDGDSVFAHPLFAEHTAFLGRLRERGLLVAAGPVAPERGEGMTIVRVDDGGLTGADIEKLAANDDLSVAGGLLMVEVRPWDVRLSA